MRAKEHSKTDTTCIALHAEIVPKLASSNGFGHKRPWEAGAYAFGGVLGEQSDWMFEQGVLAITPELGPDDAFANGDDMRGFYPPSANIEQVG